MSTATIERLGSCSDYMRLVDRLIKLEERVTRAMENDEHPELINHTLRLAADTRAEVEYLDAQGYGVAYY